MQLDVMAGRQAGWMLLQPQWLPLWFRSSGFSTLLGLQAVSIGASGVTCHVYVHHVSRLMRPAWQDSSFFNTLMAK